MSNKFTPGRGYLKKRGPGYTFSRIIQKLTDESPCGACIERIKTMNDNGWLWCWRNRKTVVGWLVEEANRRGHKIDRATVLPLFMAAYKEVRSK